MFLICLIYFLNTIMPTCKISCMEFLFVRAGPQLYVSKHEAKRSLLIARHLLLFCTLVNSKYYILKLKACNFVLLPRVKLFLFVLRFRAKMNFVFY